ncbi:MAG: hypothetical protein WA220_01220 [Candidatus Nitrosopolaris sp.]
MKEKSYFPHFLVAGEINCYKVFAFNMYVSIEKKNPLKRDQALSDATTAIKRTDGEEPRAVPVPVSESSEVIMQYAMMVLVRLVMERVLAQKLEDVPKALT